MSDKSNNVSNTTASPEERLLFALFKDDPDKCINALKGCWCARAARAAEADMKKMEAYAEADAAEIEKAKAEKPESEESKEDTSDDEKIDAAAEKVLTDFFDELLHAVLEKESDENESKDSKDSDESKDSDDSDDSKTSEESETTDSDDSDSDDDDDFDEEDRDFSNEDLLEDNGVIDDFDVKTSVRNMHIPRDIFAVIKKRYDDGERCFLKLLAGTNAPIDILVQFEDVHLPKCEYYVPIYADKTYYLRVKTYSKTSAYIYTAKKLDFIKKLVKAYKDYEGSREPAMDNDTDTVLSKRAYERSKKYFDSVLLPVVMTVNKAPKVLDADMD